MEQASGQPERNAHPGHGQRTQLSKEEGAPGLAVTGGPLPRRDQSRAPSAFEAALARSRSQGSARKASLARPQKLKLGEAVGEKFMAAGWGFFFFSFIGMPSKR